MVRLSTSLSCGGLLEQLQVARRKAVGRKESCLETEQGDDDHGVV